MADYEYEYVGQHVFDGVVYDEGVKVDDLKHIRDDLELRATDIMVTTYPKAGTTWMQEIIWLLHHGPDSTDARSKSFDEVFPYIEADYGASRGLEMIGSLPEPRFIKTHLDARYFRRQLEGTSVCPRFIVVLRNPKDVMVSYFHFHQIFGEPMTYHGTWNDFFNMMKDNKNAYGDYFDHVIGWGKYKENANVLLVTYEDMKAELRRVIAELAQFLGLKVTDDVLERVVKQSSFSVMKSHPIEKYSDIMKMYFKPGGEFFRSGKVGSWKELFTPEQIAHVDSQIAERLVPAGISYYS